MAISRRCLRSLMLIFLICQFAADSWAQTYPAKVVRLLVPFSAGSGSDTIGRIIASGLTEALGQQVIVENRAGAAGNIGAEIAARAAPDGYTMFQVTAVPHAANVSIYRKLSYNLVQDFAAVTQVATGPYVVVVHPSLPVKSISELVKLAKARPGAMDYASGGTGTATFLAVELFKPRAGIDLVHVPYRAGGEALTAVISGEVPVYFSPFAPALPQIRQGRLRPLAVTSAKRLSMLPDYPTVAESGYPGYEFSNWYGLLVPAKTPKETIATIRGAMVAALKNPTVSKRLTDLGYIAVGDQPEEFAAHIKAEIAALAKIVKAHNLTAD